MCLRGDGAFHVPRVIAQLLEESCDRALSSVRPWCISCCAHGQCHQVSTTSVMQDLVVQLCKQRRFRSWILAFTLSMVSKLSIPPTGTGSLHNHADGYGDIGALAAGGHIELTRADPSALVTRLASNYASVSTHALCLATTKYPRTLPEQLTAVAELLTKQQPHDVPVLHDARTIQQVTRVEFQILEQPEFELATLTPLRWVHIFSRRLSLWQQQQQQRQPHPAVPPVFLAVFGDQVAAGHVQSFTLLFSFHSQSDGRNSLVCVSSAGYC